MPLLISDSTKIVQKLNHPETLMTSLGAGIKEIFRRVVFKLSDRLPFEITPAKFVKFYDETVQNISAQNHCSPEMSAMLRGLILELAKSLFDDEFYQAILDIRSQQNQQQATNSTYKN